MGVVRAASKVQMGVFLENTVSVCPVCRRVLPAALVVRNNRVIMCKRCDQHGEFEAMVYGDAQMYERIKPFNKPGTPSLKFAAEVNQGCPWDCGLCPEHRPHPVLGVLSVNATSTP